MKCLPMIYFLIIIGTIITIKEFENMRKWDYNQFGTLKTAMGARDFEGSYVHILLLGLLLNLLLL